MTRPVTDKLECKKCFTKTGQTLHWVQGKKDKRKYRLCRYCVECGNRRGTNQKQRYAFQAQGIVPELPDTSRQMEMFTDAKD
jgi:hypothetical protein